MDEETTTTKETKEEVPEEAAPAEQKGAGLRFKKSRGVCRKCRRAGEKLFLKGERCFSAKCSFTRRGYAPGQHGNKGPRRLSQYGVQLREKQKLAAIYGIREKQLRKYFAESVHKKGKTGDNLILMLERRLDNVIFRAGLAVSRRQARQKIKNRIITINKRTINIPSILIKPMDIISVKKGDKKAPEKSSEQHALVPKWIKIDFKTNEINILRLPERSEIGEPIDDQLVVEFYSK